MQFIQRVSGRAQLRLRFVHCTRVFRTLIGQRGDSRLQLGAFRILFLDGSFSALRFLRLGGQSLFEIGDLRLPSGDCVDEFSFAGGHRLTLCNQILVTLSLSCQRKAQFVELFHGLVFTFCLVFIGTLKLELMILLRLERGAL